MIDRKWIGYELPSSEMTLERGQLKFFAKAIGETDLIYTDVAAAKAAGYPDLPAPPTFLFSVELESGNSMKMIELLDIPIAKLLHGEQSFVYHRAACSGDTIIVRPRIADIYDKKNGALEFVVKTAEAHNQRGELVQEMRTVLVCRH